MGCCVHSKIEERENFDGLSDDRSSRILDHTHSQSLQSLHNLAVNLPTLDGSVPGFPAVPIDFVEAYDSIVSAERIIEMRNKYHRRGEGFSIPPIRGFSSKGQCIKPSTSNSNAQIEVLHQGHQEIPGEKFRILLSNDPDRDSRYRGLIRSSIDMFLVKKWDYWHAVGHAETPKSIANRTE